MVFLLDNKEKVVVVRNVYGREISRCSKKVASDIIKRKQAKRVTKDVVQLLYDPQQRNQLHKDIKERDKYTCYICKEQVLPEDATVDHIKSRAKGGRDIPTNLACCCKACNNAKGSKSLAAFLRDMKKGE